MGESFFEVDSIEQVSSNDELILSSEEEHTPKLFSDETSTAEPEQKLFSDETPTAEPEQKLFFQEESQEEDFEIPAFLRRQKF